MKVKKLLVCGGRDYAEVDRVDQELKDWQRTLGPMFKIVCGGARGADMLAYNWAMRNCIPVSVYPANWDVHGKSAGPKRNQQMLEWEAPDVVLAFPGGAGTADMVRRAQIAGVFVAQVRPR